mgnify:CR=1 FL=1
MSRPAEYKFIPTDPEDIVIWLTAKIHRLIQKAHVQPKTPVHRYAALRRRQDNGHVAQDFLHPVLFVQLDVRKVRRGNSVLP